MCGNTADIQSATAEIRRGKKEEIMKETTGPKYNGLPYSIGRPRQNETQYVQNEDEGL